MASREEPGQDDRADSAPHGRDTFAGASRAELGLSLSFHYEAWLSGGELGEGNGLWCYESTRVA